MGREDELDLTPKEFDLLELLVRNAGQVMVRDRIMDEVWDENWFGSTKTLDMHVSALRRKLGDDAAAPTRIVTVRGVGLRFEALRAVRRRLVTSTALIAFASVIVLGVPLGTGRGRARALGSERAARAGGRRRGERHRRQARGAQAAVRGDRWAGTCARGIAS